ncbi:2',5'-phosphodiesterase 12-like [Hyalella azteca]|uniref:2',5'-phosphodiesterase 12 n=1 Tax=Hyalella azteca TaxID=294128 RepID=A0A8B7N3C7_HYAAZ|nr:2',5'-phosphodiesterase 12-like [Hyalella azteca]XP_047737500.1 2',5'-phosphodiesterase 12-like [Hyalella azteca]
MLFRKTFPLYFHANLILRMACTAPQKKDIQKAIVHQEGSRIAISFSYDFGTKVRNFNFNRDQDEILSSVLLRIKTNVLKYMVRRKKRKVSDENQSSSPVDCSVKLCKLSDTINPVVGIPFGFDHMKLPEVHEATTCVDAFVKGSRNRLLFIEHQPYILDVNPPTVDSLMLPNCIMTGFLLYPNNLQIRNANREDSLVQWFLSEQTFESYEAAKLVAATAKWQELPTGFFLNVDDSMIDKVIKVVVVPCRDGRLGVGTEAMSRCLVKPGPRSCPYKDRHQHTKELSPKDSVRVVSYNLLADTYASTEFSAENLFQNCPAYALEIDYRKQLFIDEILGYNADVVCLQEVDLDVFKYDLSCVLLLKSGLSGEYSAKPSTKEGCATFYNSAKFRLLENLCFGLSDELQNNVVLADIFAKIKKNEKLAERVTSRNTVLQACVLECLSSSEDQRQLLLVCNSHFYFHPDADHIRLLQAGIAFTIIDQLVARLEAEDGCVVRVLFCGDLNSTPDTGVYQLATMRHVSATHVGWRSAEGEEVVGVELRQTLPMASACGTPKYTNYAMSFQGCLDWIFYRTDSLRVENVVPMPSDEQVKAHTALPSPLFPSDHLALVAQLTILEIQSSA